MRSFIAAALFAGIAFAAPAPADTETVYATDLETITSCGPEITNCPADSSTFSVMMTTSVPVAPVVTSASSSTDTCTDSTTSVPVAAVSTSMSTSSVPAAPMTTSAPVAPIGTGMSSAGWSSPAAPYPTSAVSSYPVAPVGTASAVPYPVSSGAAMPSGYASGTVGMSPSAASSSPIYTGAASSFNAAGAVVGAGAFAALFL